MSTAGRPLDIGDLARIAVPADPAVAPDGARAMYVLNVVDTDNDADHQSLWSIDLNEGRARQWTTGPADSAPTWCPEGSHIAFLRAGGGAPQIWIAPADRPELARALTELTLGAGRPVFSPDGARIAFVAPVRFSRSPRPEREPIVVERLGYKQDGSGFDRDVRMHLHIVDVETAEVTQLTTGDFHTAVPQWAPDGSELVFVAPVDPDAYLTARVPVLRVSVDPAGGTLRTERHLIRTGYPDSDAQFARYNSDGTELIVVGRDTVAPGLNWLYAQPLSQTEPVRDLTRHLGRNVTLGAVGYPGSIPQPVCDGSLVFTVRDGGCAVVHRLAPDGTVAPAFTGQHDTVASGVSVASTAPIGVAVIASPGSYGELVSFEVSEAPGPARVLTSITVDRMPEVRLVEPRPMTFAIGDGSMVEGFLLRGEQTTGAAPLLIDIHGGPHNAWGPTPDIGHGYHQVLAGRGWNVLLLNPRGSDGYGDDFYRAISGQWGTGDTADFLEPIAALVGDGLADPLRLAVSGYSYGGYRTALMSTQTQQFRAAVVGGSLTDLPSAAGQADTGYFWGAFEFNAHSWTDPAKLAERSPLTFVSQVSTPTLVLHGERDDRCPLAQAEIWFTALFARGVATRMVVYPAGTHVFPVAGPPSHRRDYSERVVDWVTSHTAEPLT